MECELTVLLLLDIGLALVVLLCMWYQKCLSP